MRKNLLFILFVLVSSTIIAQKKATLMILPSDNWCTQRYFMSEYQNQGESVRIPNYLQAFQEDIELPAAISKIGELMVELGYSLKDAEMELKNLNMRTAEDNMTFSKTSGSQLSESPLDILKRRIKADIIIQLGWNLNPEGSLTVTLEAFDAYTSKRIATATNTQQMKGKDIPVALQSIIKKNIKQFDKQLDEFYNQMKKNGREIILTIRSWDN